MLLATPERGFPDRMGYSYLAKDGWAPKRALPWVPQEPKRQTAGSVSLPTFRSRPACAAARSQARPGRLSPRAAASTGALRQSPRREASRAAASEAAQPRPSAVFLSPTRKTAPPVTGAAPFGPGYYHTTIDYVHDPLRPSPAFLARARPTYAPEQPPPSERAGPIVSPRQHSHAETTASRSRSLPRQGGPGRVSPPQLELGRVGARTPRHRDAAPAPAPTASPAQRAMQEASIDHRLKRSVVVPATELALEQLRVRRLEAVRATCSCLSPTSSQRSDEWLWRGAAPLP